MVDEKLGWAGLGYCKPFIRTILTRSTTPAEVCYHSTMTNEEFVQLWHTIERAAAIGDREEAAARLIRAFAGEFYTVNWRFQHLAPGGITVQDFEPCPGK